MKISESQEDSTGRAPGKRRLLVVMAGAAAVTAMVAIGVTALLINIFERKQEARNPFYRVVDITDETEDPEIWG